MKTYEVTYDGELVGHYEAADEEDARLQAMDDIDIAAADLTAEEI